MTRKLNDTVASSVGNESAPLRRGRRSKLVEARSHSLQHAKGCHVPYPSPGLLMTIAGDKVGGARRSVVGHTAPKFAERCRKCFCSVKL